MSQAESAKLSIYLNPIEAQAQAQAVYSQSQPGANGLYTITIIIDTCTHSVSPEKEPQEPSTPLETALDLSNETATPRQEKKQANLPLFQTCKQAPSSQALPS